MAAAQPRRLGGDGAPHSSPGVWVRHQAGSEFLRGALAGVANVLVTFPLNKVRAQVAAGVAGSPAHSLQG